MICRHARRLPSLTAIFVSQSRVALVVPNQCSAGSREYWSGTTSATQNHATPIRRLMLALAIGLTISSTVAAQDKPTKPAARAGFAEARTGEMPLGAAELITPETQKTIESGLAWISKQQNADGSYGTGAYRGNVAVTSLAALSMMASGSSPGRGPYGPQIDKALAFILDNTNSTNGLVASATGGYNVPMYGHGFGTLFLAEAYGMTRRPEIREKLEKAVRLIVDSQNGEGGWRYQPVKADADLSVTVCQINALRAARNAGIFVPKATVDACIRYVKQCQSPDGGFRYTLQSNGSAFPRSAAGVVALYSAAVYDTKEVDSGITYLKDHFNEVRGMGRNGHYYYGHYYAAQAMWIRGGTDWAEWYPQIRNELLQKQSDAGSWNDTFGNEYGTAMALIVLQMPNNFLPIFQR